MLICPKCKKKLHHIHTMWKCDDNHSYDVAKRGYVNLLLSSTKQSGDDKMMMLSRQNFLSKGYYAPLCDKIIDKMKEVSLTTMVDAGCGEGYYTNRIKAAFPMLDIYGFDLSKDGVDQACKARSNVIYGVANVFHLPIQDHSMDALLSIFAPFDSTEIKRVVKQGGYFLKVGPGPKHLLDMKNIVYPEVYENEEKTLHEDGLTLVEEEMLTYSIQLQSQEDIWALFQMTPYHWKSPKEGCDRLRSLEKLNTTVEFRIEIYQVV